MPPPLSDFKPEKPPTLLERTPIMMLFRPFIRLAWLAPVLALAACARRWPRW